MNVRVGRYLIYGLIDPRNRYLHYIGKTHKRREIRLAEHIVQALENDQRPVYHWIRELLVDNLNPEIFVWKKINPDVSWRNEERKAIDFWKNVTEEELPYTHPPQTKKSHFILIKGVTLLNVTRGG